MEYLPKSYQNLHDDVSFQMQNSNLLEKKQVHSIQYDLKSKKRKHCTSRC